MSEINKTDIKPAVEYGEVVQGSHEAANSRPSFYQNPTDEEIEDLIKQFLVNFDK